MASRSLGTLTLDLVARLGGFTQGMTAAERASDRTARSIANRQKQAAKEAEQAWNKATNVIKGAFAGLTIGAGIATFFRESREAQNEQAQLAAALRSTGEAAGYSAEQLNAMAASLAANSTFGEGDINRAQTRLLAYTNIVGEQFPEAMQATIDMAARLGMSVEQSAETIGKALDVPSEGLTALSRQGFRFTEEQKKAVEQLEKTGRTAEAQGIILEALSSAYGGAARAARETFGGAISALQEEIRTLMTGSDGSLEGARGAIEDLIRVLQSPEVKAAFATLTGLIADTISVLVKGTAAFIDFGKFAGEAIARGLHGSADPIERVGEQLEGLQKKFDDLGRELDKTLSNQAGARSDNRSRYQPLIDNLRAQREAVEKEIREAKRVQQEFVQSANNVTSPSTPGRPAGGKPGLSPEEIARLARERAAREAAEKAGKEAAKQAQAYLENLRKQLQATEELTVVETVRRDIEAGRVKLAGGVTQKQLLDTAALIDAGKARIKTEEEVRKAMEATADMQKRLDDAAVAEVDKLIESNQALRDEIELIGLEGEAKAAVESARLSSAIALKEEALAMAQNAEASVAVISGLEREIELLKQRQGLIADRGKRQEEAKELEEITKRWDKAYDNIQDALGQGLYDIATGNFKNIGQMFTQMLTRMATEAVAADLMNSVFGSKKSGGSGGLLGNLLGIAAGALGTQFSAAAASAMPGNSLDNFLRLNNNFGGRAAGGVVNAGGIYRVNEDGPEMLEMNGQSYLMMGDRAGRVVPNGAGRSSLTVQVSPPPGMSSETAYQYGRRIGAGIEVSMGRNS